MPGRPAGSTMVRRTHPTGLSRLKLVAVDAHITYRYLIDSLQVFDLNLLLQVFDF